MVSLYKKALVEKFWHNADPLQLVHNPGSILQIVRIVPLTKHICHNVLLADDHSADTEQCIQRCRIWEGGQLQPSFESK